MSGQKGEPTASMLFTGYHGTVETFDRFQCPAYFADNYQTAAFFAERKIGNPTIMVCRLEFRDPYIVDLEGQSWGGFFLKDEKIWDACVEYLSAGDAEEEAYFRESGITINFLSDYAESLGYDGVIALNCYEEDESCSTQYVVFDPDNIVIRKSYRG